MSGYKYHDDDYAETGNKFGKKPEENTKDDGLKDPEYKTFQVSRWVEQWQVVIAKNKDEALDVAIDSAEWNYDGCATEGDEFYNRYRAFEVKE